jgi:putative spermidine/putrescine transport system permease protein
MARRSHPALVAFAVLVYIFLLGPLVIVAGTAFSDTQFLAFPPQGFTGRWFANVFEVSAFRETFWISLQVAVFGTLLSLLLGIPAAYALSRYRNQVTKAFANFFVLPILVPEIVFGFSVLNSMSVGLDLPIFTTLLLGHMIIVLPYSVRVVSASLANFDYSIEEAAVSLGSNRLKTFFTIVLPNIRSGIIAAFILAFITSLNNVPVSLFLTGPGISTLPIQMLTYVENFFDPTVAALSVMLMSFTVVVMVAIERTLGLSYFAR